ncbi:MAG: DNA-directed RNA polymerase subunit omega [candidate division FCPU426 bacterium]
MHHLDFEKIVDKLGSKYEAVTRMSVLARQLADAAITSDLPSNRKVTSQALHEYLKQQGQETDPASPLKG